MMGKLLTEDLGSGTVGWAAKVNGSMVCIAAPHVLHDPAGRREMRELVRRQGGNCADCAGCPIGRMRD